MQLPWEIPGVPSGVPGKNGSKLNGILICPCIVFRALTWISMYVPWSNISRTSLPTSSAKPAWTSWTRLSQSPLNTSSRILRDRAEPVFYEFIRALALLKLTRRGQTTLHKEFVLYDLTMAQVLTFLFGVRRIVERFGAGWLDLGWFDVDQHTLKLLPQHRRRAHDTIHYGKQGVVVLPYHRVLEIVYARQFDLWKRNNFHGSRKKQKLTLVSAFIVRLLLLCRPKWERSWPLSCDTGPRRRRCYPTSPRYASNKRDQPRCYFSRGRAECYRICNPTSLAMSSADTRRAKQTYITLLRFGTVSFLWIEHQVCVRDSKEYQYLRVFKNKRGIPSLVSLYLRWESRDRWTRFLFAGTRYTSEYRRWSGKSNKNRNYLRNETLIFLTKRVYVYSHWRVWRPNPRIAAKYMAKLRKWKQAWREAREREEKICRVYETLQSIRLSVQRVDPRVC